MSVKTIQRPHPRPTAAHRHAPRRRTRPLAPARIDTAPGPFAYLAFLVRRALIWIGGYLGVALIIYLASLVAN